MVLPRLAPCLIYFQRAGLGPPAHKAGAVKLTARSMLHMKHCVQTITASQSTKRLCPAAQPPYGPGVTGAGTRGNAGTGNREPGPRECCAVFPGSSIDLIAAKTWTQGSRSIKHSNFLIRHNTRRPPSLPFWLRLRHALQTAAKAAAGQPCIVI